MATALPDDSGLKHYTAKSLRHWTGPTKKPTGLKGFAAIVPEPDSQNKSFIYAATCQRFSAGEKREFTQYYAGGFNIAPHRYVLGLSGIWKNSITAWQTVLCLNWIWNLSFTNFIHVLLHWNLFGINYFLKLPCLSLNKLFIPGFGHFVQLFLTEILKRRQTEFWTVIFRSLHTCLSLGFSCNPPRMVRNCFWGLISIVPKGEPSGWKLL